MVARRPSRPSTRFVFVDDDDEAERIFSTLHRTEVEDREILLGVIY